MNTFLKYFKALVWLGYLAALGGCQLSKEQFDCPKGEGVGCQSIGEVNQRINQGGLGALQTAPTPLLPNALPQISESLAGEDLIERQPETVLRIWIAPFQDEAGNFYEGSVVHTVLKPGFWQLEAL